MPRISKGGPGNRVCSYCNRTLGVEEFLVKQVISRSTTRLYTRVDELDKCSWCRGFLSVSEKPIYDDGQSYSDVSAKLLGPLGRNKKLREG